MCSFIAKFLGLFWPIAWFPFYFNFGSEVGAVDPNQHVSAHCCKRQHCYPLHHKGRQLPDFNEGYAVCMCCIEYDTI